VTARDVKQRKALLLEEGHCLRDQALAFCDEARSNAPTGLSATSLATIIQMWEIYGVTLVARGRDRLKFGMKWMKLLRFVEPEPSRTIGLAWRQPRAKADFSPLAVNTRSANVGAAACPEMVRLSSQPVRRDAGRPTASSPS